MGGTSVHMVSSLELGRKPTQQIEGDLIRTLFRDTYVEIRLRYFEEYFRFYERELAKSFASRFQYQAARVPISSHQELVECIALVKGNDNLTRENLVATLRTKYPGAEEASISKALQLCLRLWLMIDISDFADESYLDRADSSIWTENCHLKQFMEERFPPSRWNIDAKDSRLHPSFTAVFMTDVCRLQLTWTDNLLHHLQLDRREKKLFIFTDKAFIAAHLDVIKHERPGGAQSPFPKTLLVETIWSLNLLFPHWDPATNQLLDQHVQTFHQSGPFDGPPILNLIEFNHWRDRLAELHDVIFLAPPVSWAQLFKDCRNPQQYWTFWIALVILMLTLISTVATILQAVTAFTKA